MSVLGETTFLAVMYRERFGCTINVVQVCFLLIEL